MKKIYLHPATTVVRMEIKNQILITSEVTSVSTNLGSSANIGYGGGGSDDARVKDAGSYDVWKDDWSD